MRNNYCGELRLSHNEQEVVICGWVHRRRDHGGVIFLDLRDKHGIIQVVVHPKTETAFKLADQTRNEFVLQVKGTVRPRPEGTNNTNMKTGDIEIECHQLTILNESKTPPFPIDGFKDIGEETRLKYRYIDLRRPEMQSNLIIRSKVTSAVRQYLDQRGFLDIETPVLTKETPEGARDYLVPSRTHPGQFFALPQSPQIFKQLLMISGFDRYYQIVKCFRDEDLRADRQPEFTQIDIETSFMDQHEVIALTQNLIQHIFHIVKNINLDNFQKLTYVECIKRFGSDRPDLRIPLEFVDVADLLKNVEFNVFKKTAQDPNGRIVALKVPKGASISRKQIDDYTNFVSIYGAKGLAWIKINDLDQGLDGLQSPIIKFIDKDIVFAIIDRLKVDNNDIIFFGADIAKIVNESLGALRCKLGEDLNLYTQEWAPLWVTDFPMFEINNSKKITASHHPFTCPNGTPEELTANPLLMNSLSYDMVINGYEIGGGSVRIHCAKMQQAVFNILNIHENEQREKFGFLLDALKYGTPPHAGLAFGLDRIVMLLCGTNNIREVVAFPKTQSASCLMTSAPSSIKAEQLQELNIRTLKK